jgi:hypothetical protein
MGELINPPEPLPEPDRDTLGDMQHDAAVEAALWEPPVEPMVEPAPVVAPRMVKRECSWCLGGVVVLPGHELAKCVCCNGAGWFWGEAE